MDPQPAARHGEIHVVGGVAGILLSRGGYPGIPAPELRDLDRGHP